MSGGGYFTNVGGVVVSGWTGPDGGTNDDVDRHIHLIIYQLATYLNDHEQGASIQNAVLQVLGNAPQPGEIQFETSVAPPGPDNYFATSFSVNNGKDHALTVGISSNPSLQYHPYGHSNLYYITDLQDLSLIVAVLKLNEQVNNTAASTPIFQAAFSALKAVSKQLADR